MTQLNSKKEVKMSEKAFKENEADESRLCCDIRENHIGRLMKMISDAMEKRANNDLRKENLTFMQMVLLCILYNQKDYKASFKALEKWLGVAQSTVNGIIARMRSKELIEVRVSSNDKRVKVAVLKEEGRKKCIELEESRRKSEEMLSKNLSDEEKEVFVSLLKKVLAAVENSEND